MQRWMTLILGTMLPACLLAQGTSFAFRNISINEGLSQSSVVDIAIDNAGFAWLATQDGLNRYDGKDFILFQKNFDDITTPTGNQLGKLIHTSNNELWLLTRGGDWETLNLYTQTFTTRKINTADKRKLKNISCLYPEENGYWIGTKSQGVYIQKEASPQLRNVNTNSSPINLCSNTIQQIFRDSWQQNWVLTDNGLSMINPDLSSSRHFLNSTLKDRFLCSSITEDQSNTLWLGSFGKGLYTKQKNDTSFHSFTGFSSLQVLPADLVIETLLVDEENRIWVGTYGNGLFIIDQKNVAVYHLLSNKKDPFSLAYNDVLSIKQDKYGGIWIGTDGGGLSYYDKRLNNFESLSRNNLPSTVSIEQVRSITTDKQGNIWAGTSNSGLSFISSDFNTAHSIRFATRDTKIASSERIVSLYTDTDNDIWVGTQGNGLAILDATTQKIKRNFNQQANPSYFPDHTVWCLLPDNKGMVWAGTRNQGLCLVDKQKGLVRKIDQSTGLAENNIRTLTAVSDSILCIGFENKGLQFLNTKTGILAPLHQAVFQKLFDGAIVIRSMFYRSPFLWIGTYGKGLIGVDLLKGESFILTEKNGLPNNTVYGIQPDGTGSLWLSTNKGICRFVPGLSPKNSTRSSFSTFTAQDGLQSNEFNTGAHYRSADGRLFFGGINGLSIFNPADLTKTNEPVPVVITEALIDNQPLQTDTLISYKKNLELAYNQNSISFSFAALDVISAGRLNYFYQLQGYDKEWVDAGQRNYVAYTNLRPGNYFFQVKAARHFSDSNHPATTIAIIIKPPFWKTWWFIVVCVLLLGAILYAIYRYRISQLLAMQRVRNNIASDLHDDIGSTLTNISILSELSRKNISQREEAILFLDRISEEVLNSGQALDDIVWSINTNNDTLEQTIARMRRYAAEVFDAAGINYTLHFDDKFAQRKLGMEQRRDFLLLFKEAVNNIYKHAGAKNVKIDTGIEKNKLFMRINDDGKGFDTNQATTRNGIKNMRKRVEKWEGSIDTRSKPGEGTRIAFSFYIN